MTRAERLKNMAAMASNTRPVQRIQRTAKLTHTPVELWPLLSATDRLNRETGLPAVDYTPTANPRGGSDLKAQAKFMGMMMTWDEHPYEWEEPSSWRVRRVFKSGPIESGVFGCNLAAKDSGTEVEYFCEYIPASGIAGWMAKIAVARGLDALILAAKNADEFLSRKQPSPYMNRYRKATVNHDALALAMQRLLEMECKKSLVEKLSDDIESLPDEDVVRMRPYEVADRWGVERRQVLSLFMRAVRVGALDLSWQVICPHCRGSQTSTRVLKNVRTKSRCEFCNVDFQTEFDRSVEARFSVNPSIRSAPDKLYCVGGPGKTPHILAQLRLDPQKSRKLSLQLNPGRYRIRGAQVAQALLIDVAKDGALAEPPKITVDEKGFTPSVLIIAPGTKIELTSAAAEHLDLKIEHTEWEDRAATGVIVSAMPEFFDLANKDALVPGEELAVKSVALLFTDLRGSTALYRQLGDAGAYALVREHFAVMREVISRSNGGIVKTIGDAVMAVFLTAPEALTCCFEIQKAFVELWARRPEMATIVVKLGFHCAPCMAVNLNDRIDYFGTAVNIAARVQNESKGGDIVLLESLFQEHAIRQVLNRYKFSAESFSAELKGIEGLTRLVRIEPDWGGKHLPHGTSVLLRPAPGNMPINVTSPVR